MKNSILILMTMLLSGSFPATVESAIAMPNDDMYPITTIVKALSHEYEAMYEYASQGRMASDLSDRIDSHFAILAGETFGTDQTGAQLPMEVFLYDYDSFTASCQWCLG